MSQLFYQVRGPVLWVLISAMSACANGHSRHSTSGVTVATAPGVIEGRQLEYNDPHGVNIYTFFAEGRYRYATLSQNRSHADSREGRYEYKRTGSETGAIAFKNEPAIRLVFTGPNTATGRVDGDKRVYRFRFD